MSTDFYFLADSKNECFCCLYYGKKKANTASVICYQPQQLFLLSIIHAGSDLPAAKNTKCYRSTIYFHFNRFYLWTEQVFQSRKKK